MLLMTSGKSAALQCTAKGTRETLFFTYHATVGQRVRSVYKLGDHHKVVSMEDVKAGTASQIVDARARIAELLLEIDHIVLQVNPQIEAEYATKIGYLENDLLKWQIAARRARRRHALAQARVNCGIAFAVD